MSGAACSTETQNASDGLTRQVAAAAVDRREREPERQLGRDVHRRDDRRLRVQRVEDRLDEQQVDAALDERGDLLGVGRAHLREGDRAERGVVDLRRDRERDVERPDRPGDEPRPVGSSAVQRSAAARASRAPSTTHLGREALERVVGLPDRGRREGVGGREVGAGREVGVVDLRHDLGARQVEEVGVALDVARVVAQPLARGTRPPRARAGGSARPTTPSRIAIRRSRISFNCRSRSLVSFGAERLRGRTRLGAGLFRRLVTRSPSCLSKLSGRSPQRSCRQLVSDSQVRHRQVAHDSCQRMPAGLSRSSDRRR